MKAVVQRVNSAYVKIDGETRAEIGKGIVVLFGVERDDTEDMCSEMAHKTVNLRIFEDENGKMGLSVKDTGGGIIIVSQFTIAGNCRKGLRPDFMNAMNPETANAYYDKFVSLCKGLYDPSKIGTGVFAADMKVGLENDGPVTIILELSSKQY